MTRFRTTLLLGVFLLAIAFSAAYYLYRPGHTPAMADLRVESEASENSVARARWEQMRLRNPATGRIPAGIRNAELEFAAGLPHRNRALYKGAAVQDFGWVPRGPYNVGGRTRALAFDIAGEDTILAGGVSGGMWRSTDAGRTWSRRTAYNQLPSVSCITQDPRPGKHHIWYYGTGELLGSSASEDGAYYSGQGMFKSTDNGLSWKPLSNTASSSPYLFDNIYDFVWRIAVDPSNTAQDEVYAAIFGGIVRSTNGGASWSSTLLNSTRYSSMCDLAVTDSGVVYATFSSDGFRKGVWRSANGTAWANITPPDWPAESRRAVIGVAPSNQKILYILAETPGTGFPGLNFKGDTSWSSLWKYTYLSGDGRGAGGRWENLTANLPDFGGSFGDYNPQGSYNMHVKVKPDDENVVFIGGTNLYRSTDGFTSRNNIAWIGGYRDTTLDSSVRLELHYPEHHPDQHDLIFSRSSSNTLYTASDGGIHKTTDAMAPVVSWTPLNNGYFTAQFYTVSVDHATPGDNMILGGLQDNGTWFTRVAAGGAAWDWIGSGDGAFCAVADGRTSLYVSKQEGKVYRVLVDAGGKMISNTRVDPQGGGDYLFINPFTLDPANTDIMYLSGGSDLWRNTDLTQIPMFSTARATTNWTRLEAARVSDSAHISAIGVSTAGPAHRVYYGTDDGRIFRMDNAHTGTPAPVQVLAGTRSGGGYVANIAVDPRDGNRAVAVFSNYEVQSLLLTTDAGETWTPIGGNLEADTSGQGAGPSCRWFGFLHRPGGSVYFVGTSVGLYSTTRLDGHNTQWALEGAETIGNVVVDMIDVRQSDGLVVAGTHGNGVFSTIIADLAVDGEATLAAAVQLEQNYPNPVHQSTTIRFTVPPGAGKVPVALTVYDVRGREVAMLLESDLPPGSYSEEFDLRRYGADRVPAGNYLYRLRVGDQATSRMMQVVR